MASAELVGLYREHVNRGMARLANLIGMPAEMSSAGSLVFDEDNKAHLDCGGYGVFIMGHCHPAVVAAVREQLERHPLATRSFLSPELARAAATLAGVAPKGLSYVCFASSGAEATEIGIKIARLNGKTKLVAMEGSFHGKTLGALSICGRSRYRTPFLPLLPSVEFVAFGDIEAISRSLAADGENACVILEPVQGECGVIVPPTGYLRAVRDLCDQHGAFLVLDEIQTGLGRLGAWWGADREAISPDILLVGKALSGGCVPVAAAVATASAFEPLNLDPLLHSSTFAGNPLAMAAAHASLSVIRDENLVIRSHDLGKYLLERLRAAVDFALPQLIRDVRGVGLLIGIEFPAEHLAADFILELMRRRVIVSTSLNAHRVVRFTPPAVLTEQQADWLIGAVGEATLELSRRHAQAEVGGIV